MVKRLFTGIISFAVLVSGFGVSNVFAEEENTGEISYKVVYASNGSGVDMETMPSGDTAFEGETYIVSDAVPSRQATETYRYNFLGWGTTSKGDIVTSIYVSSSNIGDGTNGTFKLDSYGRIIIYAVWEAVQINHTYGLVYTTNGVYVDQNDLPSSVTGIELGETYTLDIPDPAPVRYSNEEKTTPTHVFKGWATQGGNNNEAYAVTEITAPSVVGWAVTENSESFEVRDFEGLRIDNAGLSVDTCGRITVYAIWEEYTPESQSSDDGTDYDSNDYEEDDVENPESENEEESSEEVMGINIEESGIPMGEAYEEIDETPEVPVDEAYEETDEILTEEEPYAISENLEIPIHEEEVPLGDVPQTGDALKILKWAAASAICFAGIMLLFMCRKGKKDEGNENE